jgi:uncharacterized protein (DUF58 family)
MPDLTTVLTPRDLEKISNLSVLARTVVEGFFSGLHRSPHKGFSVEFKQHRPYSPGDELRHLDWKVFGKTDRFFIREYEQETNLRATILLDASGSMGYRNAAGFSKHHYATRVAAALAYLLVQQQDSVGLVTFDTKVRRYVPPRARPAHLQTLIDELSRTEVGGETELAKVFRDIAPQLHRRGLVIVLSDCFGDVPALLESLARFRHARHDILLFQIWDRDELEFNFRGWTRFDSLERAGVHHLVDPAALREAYLENLSNFRGQLADGCGRERIDLIPMVTDEPYAAALAHVLARRKRRV